ncbi:glycerate kinase [Aestuariivivens marinum]|uniref:glycerate kinase n=1 Tax=Aestuariivivens marinum TaxID=2913555 RepID=UPI001F56E083|nr:glycerate kinase [Aestuariivivens marinum]
MKIVLAPDKFKGSLTALQFCNAVEEGFLVLNSDVEIIKLPLADGGDGTIQIIDYYLKGKPIRIRVCNPFFQIITATYLYFEASRIAYIEMAEASGIKLLKDKQLDCKNATTFGTGQLILDAIERGAKQVILGIGGSATNDCGMGMAAALGYRFLDNENQEVNPIGLNLIHVRTIDSSKVHPRLKDICFKVACDVSNPLYGSNGTAHVYAKQKGASLADVKLLDEGLEHFSKVLKKKFKIDAQTVIGAGAAGGMGIATKVFLKGDLQTGVELIMALANFEEHIVEAEWIITGEGKLDRQTLSGKTIDGVLVSAKAKNIKIAALCGAIVLNEEQLKEYGIDYSDAVIKHAKTEKDAMQNSYEYVRKMAKIFAKKLM